MSESQRETCPICGRTGLTEQSIDSHVILAHLRVDLGVKRMPWVCFCGSTWFTPSEMSEHFDHHGGVTAHYIAHALGVRPLAS